jgi:hypothetical protein
MVLREESVYHAARKVSFPPKAEVPSARPYRIPHSLIMVYVDNAGRLEKA